VGVPPCDVGVLLQAVCRIGRIAITGAWTPCADPTAGEPDRLGRPRAL